MADYKMNTDKTWSQTERELIYCFEHWPGVSDWIISRPRGAGRLGYDQTEEERAVSVEYKKNGKPIVLTMSKQLRAVDNLRVLYYCIDDMRMQERRGVAEVFQTAYMQLQAPVKDKNPYEVLGLFDNAPLDVCESVYKTLAKKAHTDTGGNDLRMKELNMAIAKIRSSQ